MNYTASILRENEYVLDRAATFFSRNDELNNVVNLDQEKGLRQLMQLLTQMASVSPISIADADGHYLQAF